MLELIKQLFSSTYRKNKIQLGLYHGILYEIIILLIKGKKLQKILCHDACVRSFAEKFL